MSASRRAACCGVSRGSGLPASGGAARAATDRGLRLGGPRTRPRAASIPAPVRGSRLRLRHARRTGHLRDGTAAELRRALAVVGVALERIVADALVRRQPRGARRRRRHRRRRRRGHGLRHRRRPGAPDRSRVLRRKRRGTHRRRSADRRRRGRRVSRQRAQARRRPALASRRSGRSVASAAPAAAPACAAVSSRRTKSPM